MSKIEFISPEDVFWGTISFSYEGFRELRDLINQIDLTSLGDQKVETDEIEIEKFAGEVLIHFEE